MAKLNLFALKAQQQGTSDAPTDVQLPDSKEEVAPVTVESTPAEPSEAAPPPADNLDRDPPVAKPAGLAFLKAAAQPAPVAPAATPASTPGKAGLGFLAKARVDPSPELPKVVPAASAPANAPAKVADSPKPPAEKSGLELLVDSVAAGGSLGAASRFADEIPADAPLRTLPPGVEVDPQMQAFINSLDAVYRAIHEPELLGGVVRGIMIELDNHKEYRKLITPKDVHTMVKGMRESMGLARIKKEEAKAKRSPSKKSTVVTDLDTLNALEGMNFD